MNEENQLEREAGVRSKLHEKYEPWAFFSVFTVWQPHIRKKCLSNRLTFFRSFKRSNLPTSKPGTNAKLTNVKVSENTQENIQH